MLFTTFIYISFFVIVFCSYWLVKHRTAQNIILLLASYVFYGWIHPWFCYLIAAATIIDYLCGLGMLKHPDKKKIFLIASLISNLGMLGTFKYFNFFSDNVHIVLNSLGLGLDPFLLRVFLPVGISFYTFQTLSYTIDIYKGKLEPRKNFLDFAVFLSFFPQLVAGPIERATRFLPQVEKDRRWNWQVFGTAWPLILRGYLKKIIIADSVAVYADKVFMLDSPSALILLAGTVAFAVQIYADFSAYTDIARGTANLFGFKLIENFKSPYLAISPSDFWRRWHISFSSWIRDYLYIPLGGSRVKTAWQFGIVIMISMGLSGLWHGASWHFVLWGLYHGFIVFVYHKLGMGGKWKPTNVFNTLIAWSVMICLTMFGWLLFRTPDMAWLFHAFKNMTSGFSGVQAIAGVEILALVGFYSLPLLIFMFIDRVIPNLKWCHSIIYGVLLVIMALMYSDSGGDFIYFQF